MPKFSPIASYLICKNLTLSPPYGPTIHKNTKTPPPPPPPPHAGGGPFFFLTSMGW